MICRQRSLVRPVLLTALLSSVLVSCASSLSPSSTARSGAPAAPDAMMANKALSDVSGASASQSGEQEAANVPRSQPQLAKSAELVLTVRSVSRSIEQVKQIAQQHQGDLLGLQDNTPTDDRSHH
ncbi:MAG TPA: hypothetical protein V6C65_39440, partial [Allocoleopsis sp.]